MTRRMKKPKSKLRVSSHMLDNFFPAMNLSSLIYSYRSLFLQSNYLSITKVTLPKGCLRQKITKKKYNIFFFASLRLCTAPAPKYGIFDRRAGENSLRCLR